MPTSKNQLSRLWENRLPLPLKITLPFTVMFLGVWVSGTFLLGDHFSRHLQKKQQEQAKDLISLVDRELQQKIENLRQDARLLALRSNLTQSAQQKDLDTLRQLIIPLKEVLKVDIIRVIDKQKRTLLETRRNALGTEQLRDQTLVPLILSGTNLANMLGTRGGRPILVGAVPVKDQQGVGGGIILGQVLDDSLLSEINQSIGEHLVVLSDGKIVASTFSADSDTQQWLRSTWESKTIHDAGNYTTNQEFLVESVHIAGLEGEDIDLILLISQKPLQQAQQSLWAMMITLSALISLLITAAGLWLGRKVAQPIQSITAIAQQVVQEHNFELRTSVAGQDEISTLARALNQLVGWVGQYTHDLEMARTTLEETVQQRTQDLSQTLSNLKDTQAQLIQTEKMSSLGQMVAGIAHEINNPISFIQGNLKPLKEYCQDLITLLASYQKEYPNASQHILAQQDEMDIEFIQEDIPNILNSLQMGTERVRDIVVSLRNYSRLDESLIKDVDIHEGLDSTLLILNHRIKQGVQIIKNYGDLPLVRCSPSQLNQVFTNIIANALDAMQDAHVQPMQISLTTRSLPNEQVQIIIGDNGSGMPAEVKAKIFDPFFTTKAVGKGTGLGLGICYKIIQQHQGSIVVKSAPNEGTEFFITLPQKLESISTDNTSLDLAPTPVCELGR
jgi:two-component system, NtrC family, sensor kinase